MQSSHSEVKNAVFEAAFRNPQSQTAEYQVEENTDYQLSFVAGNEFNKDINEDAQAFDTRALSTQIRLLINHQIRLLSHQIRLLSQSITTGDVSSKRSNTRRRIGLCHI